MIIPKLHYISQGNSPKEHLENIQKACTSGVELVRLNVRNISEKKHLKIATEAREITSHFQTRLIINTDYKIAKAIKSDGIHIEKTALYPTNARTHLFTWQIIGCSANNLQDCETLIEKNVDYIDLGPFSDSKNINVLNSSLGIKGYTLITEALKTETPIIGFGDITINDIIPILETGVSGIAVSDEITRDFDSIRTFNQLLSASIIEEKRHTFE